MSIWNRTLLVATIHVKIALFCKSFIALANGHLLLGPTYRCLMTSLMSLSLVLT